MSEYDEVLYCPKCYTRQVFNLNGSGTVAVCFRCEHQIKGTSNIRQARKWAVKHWQTEEVQKQMDMMFKELEVIANGRNAK